MTMKHLALLCAAVAAVFFAPLDSRAAAYTWSGAGFMGSQDFLWSNPFNWVGLAAPQAGETNIIVLPNNAAPRTTTNDIAGLVIKSIRFQGDNYIVAGKSPGNSLTLTFDRFSGDSIEVTGNNCQFAPTLTLLLTNDITVDAGATFHLRSSMSGPGGLTKLNVGTLHLNSPGNNYLGQTHVTDGILDLECGLFGPTTAIPGPLLIGGTNLLLSPVVRLLNDDQISDTAPVTVQANAKLWLNTHDDVLGSLTMAGGLVNTGLGGGPTTPGTLQLNGNVTNQFTPVVNFATISGQLSLGAFTRTFHITGGQLGINAAISGAGLANPGLTKTGPGTLTLYHATNTYTGPTLIQEGALEITDGTQPLGATNSGTTVNPGAQLILQSVLIGQESLTLNGTVTNDALIFAGSNYWAGPVSMPFARLSGATNQTLNLGGPISGGALKTTGRGNVYFTGPNANTVFDLIVDRGNVYLAKTPGTDAFGGRVFIGNTNDPAQQAYVIVKANQQFPTQAPTAVYPSGVLVTDNADEVLGHLTVQGGWLINLGGKFTLNGNVTNLLSVQNGFMAGELALGNFPRIFHCAADSTLYCGTLLTSSGASGGVTKTGPGRLILADPNTYAGATIVQEGFLVLRNDGKPGAATGGVEVYSNAVLQLDHANVTNEFLTLQGHPVNYSIYVRDQCSWVGNVQLLADAGVQFENANGLMNKLLLEGTINGAGGLRVDGDGELTLGGTTDNLFNGPLWVRSSDAALQKTSGATAVSSWLRIGDNAGVPFATHRVKLGANNQIANNSLLEVLGNGEFSLNGFNDTIGALSLSEGKIIPTAGLLTLNGNVTNHNVGSGAASVYCNLSLGGATRTIFTEPNSWLSFYGDIQDGGAASGVTITGGGRVSFNYKTSYGGQTLVNASTLDLNHATPGAPGGDTQISAGGHLNLLNVRITNETLVLFGDANSPQVTFETDSNVWHGAIQLLGDTTFNGLPEANPFAPAQLLINGPISGPGGFTLDGRGYVTFRGDSANTYGGTTRIKDGWLFAGKNPAAPNNFAVPGNLVLGVTNMTNFARLRTLADNQFASGPAFMHTMNPEAFLDCDGFDQTIPSLTIRNASVQTDDGLLSLAGDVVVDHSSGFYPWSQISGYLSLGAANSNATRTVIVTNGGTLDVLAEIGSPSGTTNLVKSGFGRLWLENSNSFTGNFTIKEGKVETYDEHSFGTPAMSTIILTNGYLSIINGTKTTQHIAEPFIINALYGGFYALYADGTNELTGPITLSGNATWHIDNLGMLDVRSAVSGAGATLRKLGSGILRFSGTNANTFDGQMWAAEGRLELARTNALSVAAPLRVGYPDGIAGDAIVRWFQPNQIADTSAVYVDVSGQIELQNNDDTIGSLGGFGNALLASGTLTTGGDGTSTVFYGFISGIGGQLMKTGPGTLTLTGNNSYTGGSTVNEGVLLVNGQQPQSPVSLLTGGQLGGYGRVGNISALNGHVSPGTSPGKLTSGNLSFFSPSSLLKIEIGGTNAGVTYDQLDVHGSVLLMGGTLQLAMNFAGAVSNHYVIVNNDGADPVSGSFVGVTNGASITNNGVIFVVKYNGGDGNDIELIQQNVAGGVQFGGIIRQPSGRIEISATGIPNTTYAVDATEDLNAPVPWAEIGMVLSDGAGHLLFTDGDAPNHVMRFYRFRLP